MHSLLERQLRKAFGSNIESSPQLQTLLRLVADAYRSADEDRKQLERSLNLASEELFERNRRLERELEERRRLEAELGIAEKLRAVGQLASGIAHEINTPIQFVGDSLHFLQDAFAGILHVLSEQERLLRAAGANEPGLEAELSTLNEAADLHYIQGEVPKAIARCIDGTRRVGQIVRALKTLAHPDTGGQELADLNKAIENTLVMVANELKQCADLKLELRASQCVQCNLVEIQQVLLNLVVNAADAVQERCAADGQRGTVSVSTRDEGDDVVITIADDGTGIPEAIQARIFEQFFTTKPVGKGSGQGLPIARALVVERHGGRLTFLSVPGKGTTFWVRLPVAGKLLNPEVHATARGAAA